MATPKRDPVLAVLDYFETADLALAQQGLALAQATIKRRVAMAPLTEGKSRRGPRSVPASEPLPLNLKKED